MVHSPVELSNTEFERVKRLKGVREGQLIAKPSGEALAECEEHVVGGLVIT